jgi:hypothetical protein
LLKILIISENIAEEEKNTTAKKALTSSLFEEESKQSTGLVFFGMNVIMMSLKFILKRTSDFIIHAQKKNRSPNVENHFAFRKAIFI